MAGRRTNWDFAKEGGTVQTFCSWSCSRRRIVGRRGKEGGFLNVGKKKEKEKRERGERETDSEIE